MLYLPSRIIEREPTWERAGDPAAYTAKYATIGHEVLDQDKRAEQFPDSIFRRPDDVIDAVKAAQIDSNCRTVDEARVALTKIESVIGIANFVCSIPYYLVHSFSDGLFRKPLDQNLIGTPENALRDPHLLANLDEDFSHVDCDIGALLYLSAGEVIGIPLQMVEVPRHNFVRWRLPSGVHINWDTNYGFDKFSDGTYAARYGVDSTEINSGVYLADMNADNTLGYFWFCEGPDVPATKTVTRSDSGIPSCDS